MGHKLLQIWWVFTRLGLTSFGGPTAHIGYFHDEFVTRRGWLTGTEFAQDNALCQLVPGPASSQLGMLIGARASGVWGSLMAWLGFTTPSAIIMLFVMRGSPWLVHQPELIHGLLLGAACVVTQAVWSMARTFCTSIPNQLIAVITLAVLLTWNNPWVQMGCLVCAALGGSQLHREQTPPIPTPIPNLTRVHGSIFLSIFVGLLLISTLWHDPLSILFQSGAMVFGGGHVVLPVLQQRLVASGSLTNTQILSGYAAAQILPGPLFAIGAYVGGLTGGFSWLDGGLGVVAIFLPGWLLIMGIMPWWLSIQQHTWVQRALYGIQAGVVGVLAATLWDPILTHSISYGSDVAIWIIGTIALIKFNSPAWLVTVVCALVGFISLRYP